MHCPRPELSRKNFRMTKAPPFWNTLSRAVFGEEQPSYTALGQGQLPSYYRVSDFAESTVGVAGMALARYWGGQKVTVDRRLASLWFDMTLRPMGWETPSIWDAIAGDYKCKDGWIRLHTNARHHRDAALSVLQTPVDRAAVAEAVLQWNGEALETAVVGAGGCAAFMNSAQTWAEHPQGRALATEPLIHWQEWGQCAPQPAPVVATLAGVKVLDLTRVLAGPVATRFLAGFGAEVLRIDPPFWNEPSVEMEVTLGKRCAGLDLRTAQDRATFAALLGEADVLVHGYRADALERMGFGAEERRAINPTLVDISLNAYGWSGAWRDRRGFDSLVQMSCGIASHGMTHAQAERPVPLPVQALDHGTGYLLAACVLEALHSRRMGKLRSARLSLARTALCLMDLPGVYDPEDAIAQTSGDFSAEIEMTGWGPAHRIKPPLRVAGRSPEWTIAAGPLRRDEACWGA